MDLARSRSAPPESLSAVRTNLEPGCYSVPKCETARVD
jgi:hypothetical protein